jgi:hypothetical protein
MKMMTFPTGSTKFPRAAQPKLINHGATRRRSILWLQAMASSGITHVTTLQHLAVDEAPMFLVAGMVTALVAMAATIGLGFRGSL